MRVTVLGGTRFIGRAVVDELLAAAHDVQVVHRGDTEPAGLPDVPHVHAERRALGDVAAELASFRPDAVVDCMALSEADTRPVLAALPDTRLVVLSSMDVYRAWGALVAGTVREPVPLDETSPVRDERLAAPGLEGYEKLDVERLYLERGGMALRLPMVYGPHDYQRREWFVLRRVAAGRGAMPFGAGTGLLPRGEVGEIARGVRLAAESTVEGEVLNLGERRSATVRLWAETIVASAGAELELVRVADDVLPEDLSLTAAIAQPIVVDTSKAARLLGWEHAEPSDCVARSVAWHLASPPSGPDPGFEADDAALATTRR